MDRQRLVTWEDPAISAEAARHASGLDFLQRIVTGEIPPPPIARLIGMDLVSVAHGTATFSLKPAEFHYNPIGSVHGGIISTILDSAMACAIQAALPQGSIYTTIQLNINLVRALTTASPEVFCTGEIVHVGRRLATAEGRVYDANNKLYAHGSTSCVVLSSE